MSNQPWFRFYSETLDDLKLSRAAQTTGQQKVIILGAWAGLLALANNSPARGQLLLCEGIPLVSSEMAHKIGIDSELMIDIINAFKSLKMVHWESTEGNSNKTLVITNMHKRQFASDVSTERVRKHREKKKQEETPESKEDETPQKRCRNIPDTEQNTDTEQNRTDLTPSADADAPNLPAPEPKSPSSEPEKPKTKAPVREDQAMFSALASLCYGGMSVMNKKMRGMLNQTGKTLRDGGAKSTDCTEFSRWWYALDWRGQKKQKPQPAQVVECWGAFVEWRKDGGKISGQATGARRSTILATSAAGDHNTPSPEQLAADKRAIIALRERQARAGAG